MGKRIVSMFLVIVFVITTSGCTHMMTVQNMGMYKPDFINSTDITGSIGIISDNTQPDTNRLVTAMANNLKKNGFKVIFPYYKSQNSSTVDYIVKVNPLAEYKGSGMNFLVNFPGFLIFAPAFFGYGYKANYTFDVDITEVATKKALPRLTIPIHLDIRHADTNRTWTEISWFEVGIIALIGGIVFTNYDTKVTNILLDKYENKLGDYLATKISQVILGNNLS